MDQMRNCLFRLACAVRVVSVVGALWVGALATGGSALVNISAGLPATDALGRALPTYEEVGPEREGKFVGLFYWTWHMNFIRHPPHNVREILEAHPEAIDDYNHPAWPEHKPRSHHYFFWDEPLFGYYRNTDKWVLRKHAEMLADAGVDVIFFDCTNGHFTWKESYMALCESFTIARKDGVRTPQIAFLLPFGATEGSLRAMKELYADLYKPGRYRDLWFEWKGKPLIMAHPDNLAELPGDEAATALHAEIKEFFTFRPGQPLYNKGPQRPDHWGWLEIYPQHGFFENPDGSFEQVTVGVAQNWSRDMELTAMNAPGTFGRSYTNAKGKIEERGAVNLGYNFQEQWERALEIDPEFVFITGWNEWVAGRYEEWGGHHNAFPDQYSQEYSRDIEPMKGGHGDNYYYQMIGNIRRFKGMPPPPVASEEARITIDGKFDEWSSVLPQYRAHRGGTLHRDWPGWLGTHYTNTSGRNDIVAAKVARDDECVYFYVEAAGELTSPKGRAWMRLFIDIDRDKVTGWEGYDLVVNRMPPGDKAIVEKSSSGWHWGEVAEIEYAVTGRGLELAIPKSLVESNGKLNFEFKWSDNMQVEGDIMDFLSRGDAAPGGRFNYVYSVE